MEAWRSGFLLLWEAGTPATPLSPPFHSRRLGYGILGRGAWWGWHRGNSDQAGNCSPFGLLTHTFLSVKQRKVVMRTDAVSFPPIRAYGPLGPSTQLLSSRAWARVELFGGGGCRWLFLTWGPFGALGRTGPPERPEGLLGGQELLPRRRRISPPPQASLLGRTAPGALTGTSRPIGPRSTQPPSPSPSPPAPAPNVQLWGVEHLWESSTCGNRTPVGISRMDWCLCFV